MNRYILALLIQIPTISLNMDKTWVKLTYSNYIQQTFKQETMVCTQKILFMNLAVEACKKPWFQLHGLSNIKNHRIGACDIIHTNSVPFFTMLQFIPWDGNNNNDHKHTILLNGKEVEICIAHDYSKSMVLPLYNDQQFNGHTIDVVGNIAILNDPDHLQSITERYKTLMYE